MAYADFEYYTNTYFGVMSEENYNRLSVQADAWIDRLTFDSIDGNVIAGKWSDNIKKAVCAIADALLVNEEGGKIIEEHNDGISVTYQSSNETDENRIRKAATLYLERTGLMSRWC